MFKTAFSVPAGHYEWNFITFGLNNAPSKFQRVMDDALKQYFDWLIVYIDDILVFSSSVEQHFKHFRRFLQIIQNVGLVFSKKKLELFKTEIKYLGHIINNGELVLKNHVVEFVLINFQIKSWINSNSKNSWEASIISAISTKIVHKTESC
jgi:hypothetical protein